MDRCIIDIETRSSIDIRKAGSYRYAMSPDFKILLISYKFNDSEIVTIDLTDDKRDPVEMMVFLKILEDPRVIKMAYNAEFEWWCLNRAGYATPLSQWQDTQAHAMYLSYPASLEDVGKALGLAEEQRKKATGTALINYFCKPTKDGTFRSPSVNPEKWAEMIKYNRQDVEAEYQIQKRLDPFPMQESEVELWRDTVRMNALGVHVDRALMRGAIYLNEIEENGLLDEMRTLTGLTNPNSISQLVPWLNSKGCNTDNLRKDTVTQLLAADLPDTVRRVLEIRQQVSKTSVAKYAAMADALADDDRIRGLTKYCGAVRTGRFAGRIVQLQNLTKHHISTLDSARRLIREGNYEAARMLYGGIYDLLSQVVRTAFIPTDGRKFVVADFSAIEARIIAWLAGEKWVNDVFATHGRIYEATAAQMFHVPLETIVKGHPNYDLRGKGKVATLALGYQGGTAALIAMGALKMGLTEGELPDIVDRWRKANPNIVRLWRAMEDAAIGVVQYGGTKSVRGGLIKFSLETDVIYGQRYLTMQLPSGRKLYYAKPFIKENRFGKPAVHHYGVNSTTHKWEEQNTYSGKLTENCIAEGELVLTDHGWKPIETVTIADRVWDGVEWVHHDGLIDKGKQEVIAVDGVYMTPDHKILTEGGWQSASQSKGSNRIPVTLPGGAEICRLERKGLAMARSLRLRERARYACVGNHQRQSEVLRVHGEEVNVASENDARRNENPAVCGVALDERALPHADRASMGELRRPWYHSLRTVAAQFREFQGRHGTDVSEGIRTRPNRQQQRVLAGKLPLGNAESQLKKQTVLRLDKYPMGTSHCGGSGGAFGDRCYDNTLPIRPWVGGRYVVGKTKSAKRVYDIRNCGPRHRFTLASTAGGMIVHNCVQSIARDCLAVTLNRLKAKGYDVVFHVHDEVVLDVPERVTVEEVCDLMGEPISWAEGLVLKAAGFEGQYYKKD